jgi:hypothetical protein
VSELRKPEHLNAIAEDTSALVWLGKRMAATAAAVLGVLSFLVVAIAQPELSGTADWRLSLPGFALTVAATIASLVRREPKGYWLWAIGLGLAAAAIVFGWFLMVAIIIAAAAVLIVILHAVM